MKTVDLSQAALISILDKLHPNAYDLIQAAIEEKAIDQLGESAWLERWESGDWNIKLVLTYGEE